jgi:ferredoxin
LAISSKCIWCGHCIKFSPTNFSFDSSTHKAIVTSQENINTWKVSNAIDRCPVNAISIS